METEEEMKEFHKIVDTMEVKELSLKWRILLSLVILGLIGFNIYWRLLK